MSCLTKCLFSLGILGSTLLPLSFTDTTLTAKETTDSSTLIADRGWRGGHHSHRDWDRGYRNWDRGWDRGFYGGFGVYPYYNNFYYSSYPYRYYTPYYYPYYYSSYPYTYYYYY